ncbi:hypothetical protein D915_007002 [Fasciola hepatica]|uniref:Uncharacterized protein n=1 Tax=Fasciola hepatica TaxID=6192 RepID=A0A2H1C506_FASHE|nr:hypothetical protein D915_007002 [Fasciola hepatica]
MCSCWFVSVLLLFLRSYSSPTQTYIALPPRANRIRSTLMIDACSNIHSCPYFLTVAGITAVLTFVLFYSDNNRINGVSSVSKEKSVLTLISNVTSSWPAHIVTYPEIYAPLVCKLCILFLPFWIVGVYLPNPLESSSMFQSSAMRTLMVQVSKKKTAGSRSYSEASSFA